ncbi:PepSY-associated TM helix domain-containing protein [Nocardiopsis halotolerans]|uniref:PepSY-associated TM helix domain-containing protein n=1 Tax=Nocardiopsis halotolerans TaxID=124252 RepID=UPI0003465A27|nr:PepSY-associated TM helix domain-containing protein [Nocardiopsis halotolerans]
MTSHAPDRLDSPPPPSGRQRSTWAALRQLLLRLHFYAGILVAPFIVVAAVTGLLYAYTPQLEQALYSEQLHVAPGDGSVPLQEQVDAAVTAHPEGTLNAVRPATEPDESTRVLLDVEGLPESYRLAVFVDPHTGELLGDMTSYGSSGSLPARSWLSELHRHLHMGDVGRVYSELAASWLWVVGLGGAVLWIGRRRRNRRLRRTLLPENSATGRNRTLSWHGSIGLWALVGLLLLSATGLTWSQFGGANIGELRTAFGWTTPTLSVSASTGHEGHGGQDDDGGGEHAGHGAADRVDLDRVLESVRAAGLEGPVEIAVPAEEGAPFTVEGTSRTWPVNQDVIAVDAASGEVVETLRFDEFPLMAKLSSWGIAFHMGLLFGLPNQLFLTLVGLSALVLVSWGYRMWWLRRPTREDGFSMGRPLAPRGTWRGLPWWCLAAVVAVAVGVGLFLPVFGVSLLAFLLADAAVGAWRGRARTRTEAGPV